jgi:methionyl aminopeptidase
LLTADELSKLRKAGRVAGEAREIGLNMVKPGAKVYDIAQEVEGYIRSHGCGLAFPCNISINEVAAHYTPSVNDKKTIEAGDVVKVDCGAHLDGLVGDTAGTAEAGTSAYTQLIRASREARDTVAEFIGNGTPLSEIGRAVEMTIKSEGFVPVKNLCGHQIDRYNLHAGLSVPNYDDGDGTMLNGGMVVAIEPFATDGVGEVVNGRPGNIVRILREREIEDPDARQFFEYAKEEFRTFPFCARSCDWPNAEKYVSRLIRRGVLSSYAQLTEAGKGIVTQHEHTFYITEDRAEVTTLP